MTLINIGIVDDRGVDALLASVIALFEEDAGTHDASVDATWPVREGRDYYTSVLTDPACLLLLATDAESGRPVGHLVGKLREPSTLQPVTFGVLESMRVAPDVRGEGIGTSLVERFLAWARDRGAELISVTAYAANAGAQRFYARHGFLPQSVTLRRGA